MKHSPNFETGKCHNCGKKLTSTNFSEECKLRTTITERLTKGE